VCWLEDDESDARVLQVCMKYISKYWGEDACLWKKAVDDKNRLWLDKNKDHQVLAFSEKAGTHVQLPN